MKKLKYILFLFVLLGLGSACERLWTPESPKNTPMDNFDVLWNTVDQRYSFFSYKNIHWDSIRHHYESGIYEGMSDRDLFDTLAAMLYDLRDGHVNLRSSFDLSRNWEWYLNSPENFRFSTVEREYLGSDYKIAGSLRYTIIDSIGYVFYGSFSSGISKANLQAINDYFQGTTKAMIIDVRGNGGGYLNNAFTLASWLNNAPNIAYVEYFKTGPGHDDFGNPVKYALSAGSVYYSKPVYILTNRSCYSSTTSFITMAKGLPNVTIVGDTTGGGGGLPADYELPNGWVFRFSTTITTDRYGFNVENGIPPDSVLVYPDSEFTEIKDPVIDEVLRWLN